MYISIYNTYTPIHAIHKHCVKFVKNLRECATRGTRCLHSPLQFALLYTHNVTQAQQGYSVNFIKNSREGHKSWDTVSTSHQFVLMLIV